MGAWIEINTAITSLTGKNVAPLVGAWIEIRAQGTPEPPITSLLSWERGLKFEYLDADCYGKYVAPLVGAWIEIG